MTTAKKELTTKELLEQFIEEQKYFNKEVSQRLDRIERRLKSIETVPTIKNELRMPVNG